MKRTIQNWCQKTSLRNSLRRFSIYHTCCVQSFQQYNQSTHSFRDIISLFNWCLTRQFTVGPTVHSSLVVVFIRFHLHHIALTTNVSRMYRVVLLEESDKDLHIFVWKRSTSAPLRDYHMTQITFGVAAFSYAANQQLWEMKVNWDDQVPESICESWLKCNQNLVCAQQSMYLAVTMTRRNLFLLQNFMVFQMLHSRHTQLLFTSE